MDDQLAVFFDFENIALWAEREFFDFELTPLMEYLQSRGAAMVKRAYGDWSRYVRYRDELMNFSIDLLQIYSLRAGKNRADIRLAIDALEVAMTRPHINMFVIISGDSDFGPLVAKLREYGRYILGIGPRSITHHLLVKSCDEFVYLETILGETTAVSVPSITEREDARNTLTKALVAHGQRGEVPVLAAKLKQTMLSMNPAFNEANFGYSQFKSWLEDNRELVKLYVKDLQLYVAPIDFIAPSDLGLSPMIFPAVEEIAPQEVPTVEAEYKQLFNRLKMLNADFNTRRDVLRDIYREINEQPGAYTTDELLDCLYERYESQDINRSKSVLREILQMGFRQKAFDYGKEAASLYVPVWLANGIESEADFVSRAESDFVYAVIRAGLDVDLPLLAYIILNEQDQVDYVNSLVDDLKNRGMIAKKGKRYGLPGLDRIPCREDPALQVLCHDIQSVQIPDEMSRTVEMAQSLAKTAMVQRSQDFVASANNYLLACRLQWDAVEEGEPGATLQDLRWFMASYASANAGKLSQVNRDYAGARPYYLAFFALVQEEDPLWGRMRGLINPMLTYYWANTGRELDINTSTWNLSASSPAQIAVAAATHPNPELRRQWQTITEALAKVNSGLLYRIAEQILLARADSPEHVMVAEQIKRMISL